MWLLHGSCRVTLFLRRLLWCLLTLPFLLTLGVFWYLVDLVSGTRVAAETITDHWPRRRT